MAAAVLLPLAALHAWSGYREFRLIVRQARSSALAVAQATAVSTHQFVALSERVLSGLASEMEADLLDPGRCPTALAHAGRVASYLDNLLVGTSEGDLVCATAAVPRGTPAVLSERAWFRKVVRTRTFVVGPPQIGRATHRWVVALAVPILDAEGRVRGVLGGSLDIMRFQDLLAGVRVPGNAVVTIANAHGVVVARSRNADRWVGRPLPGRSSPETAVGPGAWISSGTDLDGIRRGWGKVELPELGWTIYVGIPTRDILAPPLASIGRQAVLSLSILALAITLAALLYARIAGSLRDLASGTRAALTGTEVPFPPGAPAEVLEVAEQFNLTLAGWRRAEHSERQAKERYRSIVDNAVFGIYISTPDGRFLEVNPALVSMLGYDSANELMATGPVALYRDPDTRAALVEEYREADHIRDVEVVWMRRDGTPITVRLNGKIIRTESGTAAFEVIAQDITAEKLHQEELRHTQKMEAVGQLAGGIAHDFNNLLTVIGGSTQLLLASLPEDDPLRLDAEEITSATARATALTRQLLAFSRKDALQSRAVDLNELIEELDKMLRRLIGEDISMETRLGPQPLIVHGDPGQIEQILMNLVINARDALPDGGRILVEARRAERTRPPCGTPEAEVRNWALISVTDNGVGMDEHTRSRIFEPFFTTKGKGEGTGLGLATAYGIIRQQGGRILVESEPGIGTRFDVWLPLEEGVADLTGEMDHDDARDRGHETILAVEDEEPVRRIVHRVLTGAGYTVLLAADGHEALELFTERYEGIDLVLTDVVMPRMKGTELAERIDAIRPDTPILFMSGYTDNLPIQDRIAERPDSFVAKPFSPGELRRHVRSMLDRHSADRTAHVAGIEDRQPA